MTTDTGTDISLRSAFDEVTFWSRQMGEHALFLHLGVHDQEMKDQGLELYNQWEQYRQKLSYGFSERQLDDVLVMLPVLKEYKVRVWDSTLTGWNGFIHPGFAEHVILELDHFQNKINGVEYLPEYEADFWNKINSDHASFVTALVDPSEREVVLTFDKEAQKTKHYRDESPDVATYMAISVAAAAELDAIMEKANQDVASKRVKSIIHPVLGDHVVREGKRSVEVLSKLII